MSDSAAADHQDRPGETATLPVPPYEPVRVVPTRPDGWPDWLGRRPISPADRGKILRDLQARYNRLVRRFGGDKNPGAKKKAITAIAHTLLKIAYQVIKSGVPYQELGADFYTRRESPEQKQAWLERQLQKLHPAAPSPSPSARRRPPYHPALNQQPLFQPARSRRRSRHPRPTRRTNQRHRHALATAPARVCRAPTGDPVVVSAR